MELMNKFLINKFYTFLKVFKYKFTKAYSIKIYIFYSKLLVFFIKDSFYLQFDIFI